MSGDGRLRRFPGSPYWHWVFWLDGREVSESTGKTDHEKAQRQVRARPAEVRAGEAVPHEGRVILADLFTLLEGDYTSNGNRSPATARSSWKHPDAHFGSTKKAVTITTDRLIKYVAARQTEGAARATIYIELALLGRTFRLAVDAKRLGKARVPKPPG